MAGSGQVDSVEKIIERYFSAVTTVPFEYKGKSYQPKGIRISTSLFFKRMVCVSHCGACCRRFTNDWLPAEKSRLTPKVLEFVQERMIKFSGRDVIVLSDVQDDHSDYYCRHLGKEDGRCGIHGFSPFSCDFELLRFSHWEDPEMPEHLGHRPFGRGWNMKRIDGVRGALCEWYDTEASKEQIQDTVRKLKRLKDWADWFGIETTLPTIIDWVARGPHPVALTVPSPTLAKKGLF